MSPIQAPSNDHPVTSARFNPLYRAYLVVTIGLAMICSIIGLPLAVIWFCGVGQWWARHYFDLMQCTLDAKALRFRKGILFQVEKTIPLENIQDVTFIEGPVLRHFQLATLKFETAGHSAGQASDMHLTGIIDAHEFRNRILAQRPPSHAGLRCILLDIGADDGPLTESAVCMGTFGGLFLKLRVTAPTAAAGALDAALPPFAKGLVARLR